MAYMMGRFGGARVDGIPIVKPPWSRITTIDLNQGEIVWQIANAYTPENIRTTRCSKVSNSREPG